MFRLLDGPANRVGHVRRFQNDEPNEQRLPLPRLDADQDVGQARENNQPQEVDANAAGYILLPTDSVRRDQAAARQRRRRQNELP